MSLRKSISNTFTVTTLVDGESAPYYFEEKYAWSNDSSTQSVTTPPSISGGWQTSIPPSNGYAYLWRMSIRHVWNESTRSYTQEAAQYFRMSGTNGTSIHIKGHVSTVQNLPTTHADGDAYVVDANGHLYMWSDESGSWVDIGVFQGEAGKTYYTHIAWASQVNYSGTTVTSVDGFITAKSPNDTTHMWMGVYIDEQSGQDESNALRYTWSYTKGDKGYDAVTYGFVFTEAFAKADASKTITGNIKGYAYKYVGDTRTPLANTIIRYGYIIDDNGTYADTTTNANGFFDAQNWFNGDNIDDYAKGSPSIFAAIQIGGVIVHVEYITISLQGDTGGRGKTGRFYYYAQEWLDDSSVSYTVTDAEAPYFLYNDNYWVFNPTNNGTYTMSEMGTPSSSNNNWKLMVTDFKFIITEAIFGSYAHFGSAIINGDWLISTHGKRNGDDSTEYTYFDASDPMGVSSSSHFVPNFCVDLNTGAAYMNNAFIKGELSGVTGSFKSLNCVNNSGTVIARISFDPAGRLMFESGDLYNQGMKDGRALRFYSGDIWCRGAFGARTRTVLLVNGSQGYYYSKGTYNAGQLVSFASATSSGGQTYYTIECYGQDGDYSGYPVDEIVFNIETGTYRYQLDMADTQRVLLINANDYNNNVFIYTNGKQEQWGGGSVGEIIKLPISFMNPQPANTVLGRGLVVGAKRDNDWG